MNFQIPKKFQLGRNTINIEYVDKYYETTIDTLGQAIYKRDTIEIKKDTEHDIHSKDYMEWVFFHELVHFIFYKMYEDNLFKNEKIVSQFATFLQQAIRSME